MSQKVQRLGEMYVADALESIAMNGDSYTDEDTLYRICCQSKPRLSRDLFHRDMTLLLQKELLCQEGRRIYLPQTLKYENSAAMFLADILLYNDLPEVVLPDSLVVAGITLSQDQRSAVSMALSHRLSIILGGAGSGKTTLISALLQYSSGGSYSVLCAPTGKAAVNLYSRIGEPARTVHSALGKLPNDDFINGSVDWHFTDLVVIDEASMMTLEMLAGILKSARSRCRIVLIGDPNQLQAVGSGNVMPDLINLGIPNVQLSHSYRQDDSTSALYQNVVGFSSCHTLEDLKFDDSFTLIPGTSDSHVKQVICEAGIRLYEKNADVQILSPVNSAGELSKNQLNLELQESLVPFQEGIDIPGLPIHGGDRIMILKNDWNNGVCNGDTGRVYLCHLNSHLLGIGVICDRGPCPVWRGDSFLPYLSLAYAITVHKSQGSEYGTVIFPLSRRYSHVLTRNLLYTAISRAKKRVILVGEPEVLNVALQKMPSKRKSMLIQKTHMCLESIRTKGENHVLSYTQHHLCTGHGSSSFGVSEQRNYSGKAL